MIDDDADHGDDDDDLLLLLLINDGDKLNNRNICHEPRTMH